MKRHLAFLAALLLAPVALGASAALADTRTGMVGGQGTAFTAACGPGEALTGIAYNAAEGLRAVGAICRPFANRTAGAVQPVRSVYGAEGGVGGTNGRCPEDRPIVTGLSVYLNSAVQVHSFRMTCHLGTAAKAIFVAPSITTGGAQPVSNSSVSCGTGSYATGLIGTHSGTITSLGLLCFDGTSAPAPQPGSSASTGGAGTPAPAPSTTSNNNSGAPTGGTRPGNNSSGGFSIGFGDLRFDLQLNRPGGAAAAGGSTPVAKEPTTVYAQPGGQETAYLNAGQQVRIESCNNIGWCRINRPTQGWVWGPDFQ